MASENSTLKQKAILTIDSNRATYILLALKTGHNLKKPILISTGQNFKNVSKVIDPNLFAQELKKVVEPMS